MGGPGSRGRRGGPRGGPVPATASASEIYQQKCQFCHGAQGQGARGPALTGVGSRSNAELRRIIHDGRQQMPAFSNQLTDAQIDAVVAYVKQLSPGR